MNKGINWLEENEDDNPIFIARKEDPSELERTDLLNQLIECYPLSLRRKILDDNRHLPLDLLKEVVNTTILSTGGAFDIAEAIRIVEEDYVRISESESFKRKLSLLEQKGANYISMIQRLERIAGSDFVLNALKFDEYMALNKSLIRNIEMVHETILNMASEEGLDLPPENSFPDSQNNLPIVPGLPCDPRIIGYILTMLNVTLKGNKARSLVLDDANRKLLKSLQDKEKECEALKASVQAANTRMKGLVPQKPKADDTKYLLKTGNKGYVRLKDNSKKPSFDNFEYDGDVYTAIIFGKKESALRYIDMFSLKRPKLLERLGGLSLIFLDFTYSD